MLCKEVRSYIRTAISLIVIWACVLGIGCQDTQNDLVSRSPVSRRALACDCPDDPALRPRIGRYSNNCIPEVEFRPSYAGFAFLS